MKMDDIIKKCMMIKGISLKQGTYSTQLILNQKEGKGTITFFPLFPGITLAYIFVNASTWPAPDLMENSSIQKGPLIINYCISGRCELILNNANYVYLKEDQISLTECFAQNKYIYPRRFYEGLELFIDFQQVDEKSPFIQSFFDMTLRDLTQMYCPDGRTYIATATARTQPILQNIWSLFNVPDSSAVLQMRLSTLSLLASLLHEKSVLPSQSCTFYTESQVEIAKATERILTSDLRQHHPAWELAASFSISETSLKNYFRGVFGQNISVYLRELRMNTAARLLITTQLPVFAIAEQVGYLNQSKFAAVFKKQFQMSPLEYRRIKCLKTQSTSTVNGMR